jgi:hypothetical protein
MMAHARCLLAIAALAAGCGEAPLSLPPSDMAMAHESIQVMLQPNAMITDIARYDILVDGGGGGQLMYSTTPSVVPGTLPPAQTFTINIAGERSGSVDVTVVVVDETGAQVGKGTASVTLLPVGVAFVTIPIDPIH